MFSIARFLRRRQLKVLKPFGKEETRASGLRLHLCDQSTDVAEPLMWVFRDADDVEVVTGSIFDLDADALISPANSFGDMGGGLDKAIDDFYGGAAQEALMARIREEFYGELPVGMAVVLGMPTKRFPFLIAAPTMRIPGSVGETVNAYLAMRAVLVAVLRHNERSEPTRRIHSLAIPGLCTGVGGMDYGVSSAEQMRAAYDNVIGGRWREVVHPAMAPFAFGNKRLRREGR
jgi:O-acetyl-ADP-ribose deacetylase (regulator of RNase III)